MISNYIAQDPANEGVTHVFVRLGSWVDQLVLSLLRRRKIKVIVPTYESGAAFMVDKYNIPLIFVVLNNSTFVNPLLYSQQRLGVKESQINLLTVQDWSAFTNSLNLTGLRVTDPSQLVPIFKKALALNTQVLVEFVMGNHPIPKYEFDKNGVKE